MDDLIAVEIGCEDGMRSTNGDQPLKEQASTLFEPNHVLQIVSSLQEEQKRSTELMDTIRREHKKAVSLRRLVAGLTVFVVLLAVANIGTSFVAARLAQDIRVGIVSHDLTTIAGERVGTTAKETEIRMDPVDAASNSVRHRHLQSATNMVCGTDSNCSLQGMLKLPDAIELYRAMCPEWPNQENVCRGEGVPHVNLNCNGVRSTIYGGRWLPPFGPALDSVSWQWMMFPNDQYSYFATETTYDDAAGRFQDPCVLNYHLTMACETNMNDCAVFASFDMEQCPGRSPSICGEP